MNTTPPSEGKPAEARAVELRDLANRVADRYWQDDDVIRVCTIVLHKAQAALSSPAKEGATAEKHDPRTGPCPTCGFHIRTVAPQPFIFDDEV